MASQEKCVFFVFLDFFFNYFNIFKGFFYFHDSKCYKCPRTLHMINRRVRRQTRCEIESLYPSLVLIMRTTTVSFVFHIFPYYSNATQYRLII